MTTEEMKAIIKSNPGLTCRELGRLCGISWQKANAMLGKLEREGTAMFTASGTPCSIIWFHRKTT